MNTQYIVLSASALFGFIGLTVRTLNHEKNLELKDFKRVTKKKLLVFLLLLASIGSSTASGYLSYQRGKILNPAFSVKLNFEEASRGLNPDETRLNADDFLNEDVLNKVIEENRYDMTAAELRSCLSVKSSYDSAAINTNSPKIASEYQISLNDTVLDKNINTDKLIDTLAEDVKEDYIEKHTDDGSILNINLENVKDLDYMYIDDYLEIEAQKIEKYLNSFKWEEQTYMNADGETFGSLAQQVDDYINTPLNEYMAYVSENGLSKDSKSFISTSNYKNKILKVNYDKKMASYTARINAINIYDPSMANVVLVPTHDLIGEFYMSRTKIGVDYFAKDANNALNEAQEIKKDISTNSKLIANIKKDSDEIKYVKADAMVNNLCEEIQGLAESAKKLHSDYVNDKMGGYITLNVYHPDLMSLISIKKSALIGFLTFVMAVYMSAEIERVRDKHVTSRDEK